MYNIFVLKIEKLLNTIFQIMFVFCMSGKLPPRKIGPPVRVRVWFRISVRIRAGGQFSSGAIFLEPKFTHPGLTVYQ